MSPRTKHQIKALLKRMGFLKGPKLSMVGALRRAKAAGIAPRTIIDVGVADGTFDLYDAFPNSRFLLIEPMAEFEVSLRTICEQIGGEYILAAASFEKGHAVINFGDNLHGASLSQSDSDSRKIPVITVDDVVKERCAEPPFLLKVDVQGAEFDVLAGAVKTLSESDMVILEVPMFDFAGNGITIVETVARMNDLGFLPYDIFDGLARPLDGALGQVDIAFVRKTHPMRQNAVWASSEQAKRSRVIHKIRRILRV